MRTGNGSPDRPALLREILQFVLDVGGIFLAGWRLQRRTKRHRAAPETAIERAEDNVVALDDSESRGSEIAQCLHCGRSTDRVRAFGCGDIKETKRCLMLSR